MMDPRLRILRRGANADDDDDQKVLAHLDATTTRVVIPDDPDWAAQLLALALVDLLARVFPRIEVVCDPRALSHPWLPPGPALLEERLQAIRRHGWKVLEPTEAAVTVVIGDSDQPADIYADGHGWQAYLGSRPSVLGRGAADAVVFGPLTSACRAAAHICSLALKDIAVPTRVPDSVYWSGLDFRSAESPLAIEPRATECTLDAVLGGAGSVGGAAVYAWARSRHIEGSLQIVDPQDLIERNFDRALLATSELSATERPKAEIASEALAHVPDLVAVPHVCDLGTFVAHRPRTQALPLTLCAVDSGDARREIQDCLPLHLINAACDPTDAVVSGHRTGDGACVGCLFMAERMDSEHVLYRLISRATGLIEPMVITMMAKAVQLSPRHLDGIERHRGEPPGALRDWEGKTLVELYEGQLVYGGLRLTVDSGAIVAVAAPWVTALAGFLLAAEAFKAGNPALADLRLGPYRDSPGAYWRESPYGSPSLGRLRVPPRWSDQACLCNSPRRRRLIIARYGLTEDEYSI